MADRRLTLVSSSSRETSTTRARRTNPRGHGDRLREEVLAAAERLLAEHASRDGIGLRAIAREAGVAAPSIYAHFADRDAVIDAVVERAYRSLWEACSTAASAAESRRAQVHAICVAYIAFARTQPGRYRVLFERSTTELTAPHRYAEGVRAFQLLQDALGAESDERAQQLWLTLHGLAVLPSATPGFPWIATERLIEMAVDTALR
jgi:AcrR family transcriptional regulator